MRTSDILNKYKRNTLDPDELSEWAEFLLSEGHKSEDIYFLMSKPEMHWSELPTYVEKICKELNICSDFADPNEAHKKVAIAEYTELQARE